MEYLLYIILLLNVFTIGVVFGTGDLNLKSFLFLLLFGTILLLLKSTTKVIPKRIIVKIDKILKKIYN